jgi:hypothetical protein
MFYALVHFGSFLLPWGGVFYVFAEGFKDHLWQGIILILIGLVRGFINSSAKGADMMTRGGDMEVQDLDRWNTIDLFGKIAVCIGAIIVMALV